MKILSRGLNIFSLIPAIQGYLPLSHPHQFPDDPDVISITAPIINRCFTDTGDMEKSRMYKNGTDPFYAPMVPIPMC